MNKFIPVLLLGSALGVSSYGQTFLVDLNNVADSNGFPDGASAWNSYAAPSDVDGGAIHDSTGSTGLGLTLGYSGTMRNSSNGNSNTFANPTGGPSWVTTDGTLANTGAAADYFYTDTQNLRDFTISFGGLNEGDVVNLDLWFSRTSGGGGQGYYEYSLDGGVNWFGFNVLEKDGTLSTAGYWAGNNTQDTIFRGETDGNNAARYMNADGLNVGASGTVDVRVSDSSASSWVGLGAARLSVVPEPGTYALLFALAVGGVAYMRRSRR